MQKRRDISCSATGREQLKLSCEYPEAFKHEPEGHDTDPCTHPCKKCSLVCHVYAAVSVDLTVFRILHTEILSYDMLFEIKTIERLLVLLDFIA